MLIEATEFLVSGGIYLRLMILAGCILGIIFLPSLVECFPSMLAALAKWKESENINSSAKLSHYRTQSFIALIIPFLLIASRYELFSPAARFTTVQGIGITAAAFFGYMLVRVMLNAIFRNRKMRQGAWETAVKAPEIFFCVLVIIMMISAIIFHVTSCPDDTARTFLLWEIGVLYLLCIIRKTQIFAHYRGGFSGFLYLCTLEIIPSGLLIAANLIF